MWFILCHTIYIYIFYLKKVTRMFKNNISTLYLITIKKEKAQEIYEGEIR